jgi:phytoene synthase
VVPASRKARLLARSLVAAAPGGREAPAPPLAQTQFLVEAIAACAPRAKAFNATHVSGVPWWNLYGRVLWTVDLFERLERRAQVQRFAGD